MTSVGRVGDQFTGGDVQLTGSPNVFVNGIPVSRMGDDVIGHIPPIVSKLIATSATVFVNGLPIGRIGDKTTPHTHTSTESQGTLIQGSPNVFAHS